MLPSVMVCFLEPSATHGVFAMHEQMAFLPLTTYPETAPDDSILAALGFAASLGVAIHATTFAVSIPQMTSPLGSFLLDVPGLVRAAEEKSRADCLRLQGLVQNAAGSHPKLEVTTREVVLGGALDAAASAARYYDLSIVPWSGATGAAQDLAQAVVFGSGRPTILVPPTARPEPLKHIAIAWDASRVAARALWDALALLPENGRITVLTIRDEKPLSRPDLARSLASSLEKRGYNAQALDIALGEKAIAEALQDSALEAGAQLLAMGGFGHSRIRDFILGGATMGVLHDLRLPTLISH
jgi:nucleotide-binding universal stress UspA family protein